MRKYTLRLVLVVLVFICHSKGGERLRYGFFPPAHFLSTMRSKSDEKTKPLTADEVEAELPTKVMSSLWSWIRLPFYVGSSLIGVGGGALYYYQKCGTLLEYYI